MRTLVERLGELDAADFRVRGRTKHKASEIACMTICAQIAGATSFYDMHSYATEKLGWFRGFLKLENGVPSHDTFRRFWKRSSPARLNSIFMEWVDETCELADGDGIHIDGKCLRRAVTKLGKQPCIVSAYSSNERIVIGQVKADEKSNEITAIPNLIDTLYLMGCIVTIDAAGCQRKIVRKIVDKHADYLISLKGNQSTEGALRAKRPAFQRSAASIQRNWPLNAERCAVEHFGRRPLTSNGSQTGENGPDSRAWS